ncbi:MAG: MBL fold metallo-hydrolase [Acidobacteria bacterium]|nr:MBL fold metallo-hydrolase [Acidobacteriota bacterium]
MIFKQIRCGGDRNFGYLLADESTHVCALVDPSPDPEPVLREVRDRDLDILYAIATHDHFDHTAGIPRVQAVSGVKTVFSRVTGKGDIQVADGDVLPLGEVRLQFLLTPGHTPDAMCVLSGNRLMTGDTLFVGKVGGTHSREATRQEFESLRRLMTLPAEISVWPGHDYGVRSSSTIDEERETNPFCQRLDDFTSFCWLKDNWSAYKREHGIP